MTILDQLRIKYVIGIGDGAGSNIIVRFGMMHVTRCLGVILLNPTTNKVTMMDNLKDRFHKWKISNVTPTGAQMVAFRKFGHKVHNIFALKKVLFLDLENLIFQLEDHEDKAGALEKFKEEMAKQALNKKNVQKFVDAYMNRVDITGKLAAELRCDALLVVGSKSSQSAAAEYMHSHMDKVR